jgi:hypothetical protein
MDHKLHLQVTLTSFVIGCFRADTIGESPFRFTAHQDVEQGKATDKRLVLGDEELSSWRLVVGRDAIDDEASMI